MNVPRVKGVELFSTVITVVHKAAGEVYGLHMVPRLSLTAGNLATNGAEKPTHRCVHIVQQVGGVIQFCS